MGGTKITYIKLCLGEWFFSCFTYRVNLPHTPQSKCNTSSVVIGGLFHYYSSPHLPDNTYFLIYIYANTHTHIYKHTHI